MSSIADVIEIAEQVAEQHQLEVNVEHGHSSIAGPWATVQFGRRLAPCCPTQRPLTIGWTWVTDHEGVTPPQIEGTRSTGQCCVCGSMNVNVVRSEVVFLDLDDDIEAQINEAARQTVTLAQKGAVELRARIEQRLRDDLRLAIETDTETGSDTEPGAQRNSDGEWEAWDYDPTTDGDVIVVTA